MHRPTTLAVTLLVLASFGDSPICAADTDAGFFGIASGGESFGDHPRLFPLLDEAGVSMVRSFSEWASFQPEKGKWDWSHADALVDSARKNRIQIAGVFMYLAPWASSAAADADHGNRTRTFPIKDMQSWRDYVEWVVTRYRSDITYWEVYNEFNSPGFAREATVKDYVAMVRDTYKVAKKVDPNFANNWGWNFRIDTVSSPDDIWVKEVIVGRVRPRK